MFLRNVLERMKAFAEYFLLTARDGRPYTVKLGPAHASSLFCWEKNAQGWAGGSQKRATRSRLAGSRELLILALRRAVRAGDSNVLYVMFDVPQKRARADEGLCGVRPAHGAGRDRRGGRRRRGAFRDAAAPGG